MALDLVCGMIVDEKSAPAKTSYQGTAYYFCAAHCKEAFEKEPKNSSMEPKNGERLWTLSVG